MPLSDGLREMQTLARQIATRLESEVAQIREQDRHLWRLAKAHALALADELVRIQRVSPPQDGKRTGTAP